MGKLNVTRRTFARMAVASAAAASLATLPATSALAAGEGDQQGDSKGDVKRIRSCCRACGKNECGVWVTVQNGRATMVEGDESCISSQGNCCTKSQASIQAAYHPDRLAYPLRRTNPKGGDPGWQRISWDEALRLAADKYNEVIAQFGGQSNFVMGGTSRVWGQTGAYTCIKAALQTPNSVQALQVCKGPRFFANQLVNDMGLYWYEGIGAAKVYVQWGTAVEYSNYDNSCRSIIEHAENADCHIVVDPRMTPMGKEADYWLPIRPGTDGAIAAAWTNIVIRDNLFDSNFVKRWTNAACLVVEDMEPSGGVVPDGAGAVLMRTRLLKECDIKEGGSYLRFMVWDNLAGTEGYELHQNDSTGHLTYWDNGVHAWEGEVEKIQDQGKEVPGANPRQSTAFLPDKTTFFPEKDPALTGEFEVILKDGRKVKAVPVWQLFSQLMAKYTPEEAEKITGVDARVIEESCLAWATPDPSRGYGNGGLHYQLAPDQIGNAISAERILAILSAITDNTDVPGGNRGMTRMLGVNGSPGGAPADKTLVGTGGKMPFDFNEKMAGGEKFPLIRWYNWWCDCATLWDYALSSNPYPVKAGYCCSASFMNMANSNTAYEALKGMDFFAAADLWHTPTTELADVLLPAQHWLEVNSPRLSQGPSGAIGATIAAISALGEAKCDSEINMDLLEAMGISWTGNPEHPRYTLEEELNAGVAGMRMSWTEYAEAFQEHGWWDAREKSDIWHSYRRWETGKLRQHASFGTIPNDGHVGFYTPTGLTEIWSTVVESYADPADALPDYEEPPRSPVSDPESFEKYPLLMTTGSRQPVYFHTEHRQLPWCRELWPVPRLEMNPADAQELGLEQGDWVWIENDNGRVRQVVDLYAGIQKGVVNANHGWWFPEFEDSAKGYDLCNINCINYKDDQDRFCGAAKLRGLPVKVYKATAENSPGGNPVPCDPATGREIIHTADDPRLQEWLPNYEGRTAL